MRNLLSAIGAFALLLSFAPAQVSITTIPQGTVVSPTGANLKSGTWVRVTPNLPADSVLISLTVNEAYPSGPVITDPITYTELNVGPPNPSGGVLLKVPPYAQDPTFGFSNWVSVHVKYMTSDGKVVTQVVSYYISP